MHTLPLRKGVAHDTISPRKTRQQRATLRSISDQATQLGRQTLAATGAIRTEGSQITTTMSTRTASTTSTCGSRNPKQAPDQEAPTRGTGGNGSNGGNGGPPGGPPGGVAKHIVQNSTIRETSNRAVLRTSNSGGDLHLQPCRNACCTHPRQQPI